MPLLTEKNHEVKLRIEVYVGQSTRSQELKIIEIEKPIPKFVSFAAINKEKVKNFKMPKSHVKFDLKERTNRLKMWLAGAFMATDETNNGITDTKVEVYFVNVKNKRVLSVEYDYNAFNMIIRYDDIEIVSKKFTYIGEVVQDMAEFIGLQELSSEANFPEDMNKFRNTLDKISDLSENKVQISAGMAEKIRVLKTALIQGEDARSM